MFGKRVIIGVAAAAVAVVPGVAYAAGNADSSSPAATTSEEGGQGQYGKPSHHAGDGHDRAGGASGRGVKAGQQRQHAEHGKRGPREGSRPGAGQKQEGKGPHNEARSGKERGEKKGSLRGLETGTLSGQQVEQMLYMFEEEKMAGDLYEAFYDRYGQQIFDNIASSEDRHQSTVERTLTAYNVDVPPQLPAGQFSNEDIQATYDKLLAQGLESVEDAYQVGVTVEKADMADLQEAIFEVDAPLAKAVYERLLSGSEKHLQAFSR